MENLTFAQFQFLVEQSFKGCTYDHTNGYFENKGTYYLWQGYPNSVLWGCSIVYCESSKLAWAYECGRGTCGRGNTLAQAELDEEQKYEASFQENTQYN